MKKDNYDVVIIGAGVAGLVCGNYLTKSGLKVLIIEKNNKPGGYCTSFKRDGFTFDSTTHYVGSLSENGMFRKVLMELSLEDKINFYHPEIFQKINLNENICNLYADFNRTIDELQNAFPTQHKTLKKFKNLLIDTKREDDFKFFNINFGKMLDSYFDDNLLKNLLGSLLYILGLNVKHVSWFVASGFLRTFIIDGGYYPKGGLQLIPDTLLKNFKNLGGKILLNKLVTKIRIKNGKINRVVLEDGESLGADYVVSNADALSTFFSSIGEENLNKEFVFRLKSRKVSTSCFLLFLSTTQNLGEILRCPNIWYGKSKEKIFPLPEYIEEVYFSYLKEFRGELGYNKYHQNYYLALSIPSFYKENNYAPLGNESLSCLVYMPYIDDGFWQDKESIDFISNLLITRLEEFIPPLRGKITIKEIATPLSLKRFTLNSQGACYGWQAIPAQSSKYAILPNTPIENLYLTGHWTIPGSGIANCAYSGRNTAKLIKRKIELES